MTNITNCTFEIKDPAREIALELAQAIQENAIAIQKLIETLKVKTEICGLKIVETKEHGSYYQ